MKRYIRASDYRQFINQMEHLLVHTNTPYEEILDAIDAEFRNTSQITQEYKEELDRLFDKNASDAELNKVIDSASYDIEDTGEYQLLYYYFDRKYKHKYSAI